MNEADTCRKLVRPQLEAAGWDITPHTYNEQTSFTDGRIVVAGTKVRRRKRKVADFLLRYTRDITLAVVESKAADKPASDGIQQAKKLRVVQYSDYAAEKVRTLYPTAAELRSKWADPDQRKEIIGLLEERGIDFDELASAANQPDADPFDLLCHLAFNAPPRTRRERADRLKKDKKDFFDQYNPEARAILNELLEKYAEHGTAQFVIPDVLEVPPISEHGNLVEIANLFGGADKVVEAVHQLQTLLYAA
jgi:type I site-specific restriction endonuclease